MPLPRAAVHTEQLYALPDTLDKSTQFMFLELEPQLPRPQCIRFAKVPILTHLNYVSAKSKWHWTNIPGNLHYAGQPSLRLGQLLLLKSTQEVSAGI